MKKLAVVAHRNDNVATTVKDLSKGQEVIVDIDGREVKVILLNDVPFGHKFAIKDIQEGGDVVKYGEVIGRATKSIKSGEYVHVHNIESVRGRGDLEVDRK